MAQKKLQRTTFAFQDVLQLHRLRLALNDQRVLCAQLRTEVGYSFCRSSIYASRATLSQRVAETVTVADVLADTFEWQKRPGDASVAALRSGRQVSCKD